MVATQIAPCSLFRGMHPVNGTVVNHAVPCVMIAEKQQMSVHISVLYRPKDAMLLFEEGS